MECVAVVVVVVVVVVVGLEVTEPPFVYAMWMVGLKPASWVGWVSRARWRVVKQEEGAIDFVGEQHCPGVSATGAEAMLPTRRWKRKRKTKRGPTIVAPRPLGLGGLSPMIPRYYPIVFVRVVGGTEPTGALPICFPCTQRNTEIVGPLVFRPRV